MFTKNSFQVFQVPGLDTRMDSIRQEIQPIFQELGEYFSKNLQKGTDEKLPVHIAQHRRRSVHPPESTWMAMGGNTRGYKSFPHFQVEINPSHIAMWLALIDQPKKKSEIATAFLNENKLFKKLPKDTYFSLDHTQPNVWIYDEKQVKQGLERLRDVKKGELLIGRIISKESTLLQEPLQAKAYMLETFQSLLPLYTRALSVQQA